jgi:hypothetical protein
MLLVQQLRMPFTMDREAKWIDPVSLIQFQIHADKIVRRQGVAKIPVAPKGEPESVPISTRSVEPLLH